MYGGRVRLGGCEIHMGGGEGWVGVRYVWGEGRVGWVWDMYGGRGGLGGCEIRMLCVFICRMRQNGSALFDRQQKCLHRLQSYFQLKPSRS